MTQGKKTKTKFGDKVMDMNTLPLTVDEKSKLKSEKQSASFSADSQFCSRGPELNQGLQIDH